MNSIKPINIYILLWCGYLMQGILYDSGGFLSRLILLVIMIWSMRECFIVNTRAGSLPSFLKSINIFLLVITIYGAFLIISGKRFMITEGEFAIVSNFDYLKTTYMSLLPIYVFYNYAYKGQINNVSLVRYTVPFIILTVILFVFSWKSMLIGAIERGSTQTEFTNNIGYNFLHLIPLLFLWYSKPFKQYLLLTFCLLLILFSMKRGAILIACVCFFYFIYSSFRSTTGKHKIYILVFSASILLLLYFSFSNLLEKSEYFLHRIEQTLSGDSSNRDQLYSTLLEHFTSEHNIFRFLFGNGANATLSICMNYAHNDWLEIAINNGVLGLLVYFCCFVSLLKDYFKAKILPSSYHHLLMISFIILLMSSIFSMAYNSISLPFAMTIGYALTYGQNTNKREM